MKIARFLSLAALLGLSVPASAQEHDAEKLAKQINNPVAALISVPFEWNTDSDIGPLETGETKVLKASPVLPIDLNENWNLISRAIIPYIDSDIPEFGIDETGLGDIAWTNYFSPKAPTSSGWIWGAGPLLLLDTAADDAIGGGKWGMGPAFVGLKQSGPWTVGALTHYLVDIAGDDDRSHIEQYYLQPFLAYNFSQQNSVTIQAEITRDFRIDETSAPAILTFNRTTKIGPQLIQWRVGVKHWLEQPEFGPDSTELNLRFTLLYPKH